MKPEHYRATGETNVCKDCNSIELVGSDSYGYCLLHTCGCILTGSCDDYEIEKEKKKFKCKRCRGTGRRPGVVYGIPCYVPCNCGA